MKYISVIFFSLATLIAVPSFSETLDDLVVRDGTYYAKFTDLPFSGTISGSSQGKIRDGKREGLWRLYYGNGQLREKANYENGNLDGSYVLYSENGAQEASGEYVNGIKEGIWRQNDNISPFGRGYYDINYNDGVRDGEFKKISTNTELVLAEGSFKGGIISGKVVTFYETGEIHKLFTFTRGKVSGEFISFYKSGKVQQKGIYENDIKEGEFITFYETGEVQQKGIYESGSKEGIWISYFKNKQIRSEGQFAFGRAFGIHNDYHETGLLHMSGEYKRVNGQGCKQRPWLYFTDKGEVYDPGKHDKYGKNLSGSARGIYNIFGEGYCKEDN